jgi:serine/threonine protein kinase
LQKSPQVILMGFARHNTTRILVYELLPGGDVHQRIRWAKEGAREFTAAQRVSAALDAAQGISHLHHSRPKAFHRDIKTPNIILDRRGTAKMGDFGLACVAQHGRTTYKVAQTAGERNGLRR